MSLLSPILVSDSEGVKWAKLQRQLRLVADNAGISYTMSFPLSDILVSDTEGTKWAKLGAWANLLAVNIASVAPSTAVQQKGTVALVAGTQSYAIVFSPTFASIPTFFGATVRMPNSSGEVFEVSADLSTLTAAGVTVWLSGVPTAASAGGSINWLAIL